MSFGVYTRVDKTNRNLLRNKTRYAKTKKNALLVQRKVKLQFPEHNEEDLSEIKRKIWEDIERSRIRRSKVTVVSILVGLFVFIRYLFKYNFI